METQKTILVIEDDPGQQEIYRMALELAGFQVVVRGQADAGLRWLEQIQPDLILLDLMLPGKSGVEMLSEIRQRPNGQEAAIIVVSAIADSERAKLAPFSVHAILEKPLAPRELIAAVKAKLD
jgi:DNA-binding response OmpR family regulator